MMLNKFFSKDENLESVADALFKTKIRPKKLIKNSKVKGIYRDYCFLSDGDFLINYPQLAKDAKLMLGEEGTDNYFRLLASLTHMTTFSKYKNKAVDSFLKKFERGVSVDNFDIHSLFGGQEYSMDFLDDGMSVHYDAPYGFSLKNRKVQNSIAAITFDPLEKAVRIVQIQAHVSSHEERSQLRWEKALFGFVEEWARYHNIPEIQSIPHHKNKHLAVRENGKMLYDVTAKRSGFKYDSANELFIKKLSHY